MRVAYAESYTQRAAVRKTALPLQPPRVSPGSVAPPAAAARVREISASASTIRHPGPGAPRYGAPCSRRLHATRKLGLDAHPLMMFTPPPRHRVTTSAVRASCAGPGGGGRQPKVLLAARKWGLVAQPRGSPAAVSLRRCSLSQSISFPPAPPCSSFSVPILWAQTCRKCRKHAEMTGSPKFTNFETVVPIMAHCALAGAASSVGC